MDDIKTRIGFFSITEALFQNPKDMITLFRDFPCQVLSVQKIDYVRVYKAISPYFDPVSEGQYIPHYTLVYGEDAITARKELRITPPIMERMVVK